MPQWSATPPTPRDHHAFRILRTPRDKPLLAICTCHNVVGAPTHYVNNRTMPCEGPPNCKACAEGNSWRWHGYLSALKAGSHEHFLFEFTAAASDTFKNYMAIYGTLRHCKFTASRSSLRPNGRVVIACQHVDEASVRLPDAPDIRRILCHIWGVPFNDTKEEPGHRPPFQSVKLHPSNRNGN